MTINTRSDAPKDGAAVIADALQELEYFPPVDPTLGGAAVDLSQPIAVYYLGLSQEDFHTANLIDKAQQQGWRYIVEKGDGETVSFVDVREEEAVVRFSSISTNSNASALLEAAHLAQEVASPIEGNCEVRALEVPAAKVSALWLVHERNQFIPYVDVRQSMRGKVYEEGEFLAELQSRFPTSPNLNEEERAADDLGG